MYVTPPPPIGIIQLDAFTCTSINPGARFSSIQFIFEYVSMFVVLLPVPVFLMHADVKDQMRGIHAWRHWSVGEKTGPLI